MSANKKLHEKFLKKARSHSSSNPNRPNPAKDPKGQSFYRSAQTIRRLNMYKEKPDYEKMWKQPDQPTRIEPNRKWFGNVRSIDQKELERLRKEMQQKINDPRSVLIQAKKLPMSLLRVEEQAQPKVNILQLESYDDTFGPKSRRKRCKINYENLQELQEVTETKDDNYEKGNDKNLNKQDKEQQIVKDKRFEAGQSKRIWEELYKVIDSSDVLCIVIDARDPMGTRCYHIEEHLKNNHPQKHLVFILNKCDLIPTYATTKWVAYLNKICPTIAFHSSITKPFGKKPLINLLKQYDKFHRDKQNISIGMIGYPNVGKSSVINTLKKKAVCKSAPIPGETRVWQYISLTKRIYLIDCPGVVYNLEGKNETDIVLKGCLRAEKIEEPEVYIDAIIAKVEKQKLINLYGISDFIDGDDMLKQIAHKMGKLRKGGEADTKSVSKIVLMDWQRGNIPYFSLPPGEVHREQKHDGKDKKSTKDKDAKETIDTLENKQVEMEIQN